MHASSTALAIVSDGRVADAAQRMLDSLRSAVPRMAVALVVVLVGWGLSRLLRAGLRRWLATRQTPSFTAVISTVAGALLGALSVLIAITILFPSVKPVDLLSGLGFFSIAVGFAFQDILENSLSGLLMLFRQPFRSGDQIEVVGHSGTVQAITIRETRIKTFDGQLILIPNRDVYKNVIRVQTHFETRRMSFAVGTAYENDPWEACAVIVEALAGVDGVLQDPAPEALITTLGVSTVDIDVRLWTSSQQHEALTVLHRSIDTVKKALDKAGIEMPAEIIALQATPSFRAAMRGDGDVTPGGSLRSTS